MRAIWSGVISFGLVSVPVRMYSATESDLMAALRESVERTQRKQKKTTKRKAKKAS